MVLSNTLQALRELFARWSDDTSSRPIVCTPIRANHGTVSAWVISVNGSPPRGNLYVDDYQAVLLGRKPKVLGGKDLDVVRRFVRKHLSQEKNPVILE